MRRVTVGFLGLFGPCGLATIVFVQRPVCLVIVLILVAILLMMALPTFRAKREVFVE